VELSSFTFAVGEEIGVTLKYRDNKNSMYESTNGFYGDIWWTSDSPISTLQRDEGHHNFIKPWSLISQTVTPEYVEETWFATVKAPSGFGRWRLGMVIIDDKVKNYSIYRFDNSLWGYQAPYSEVGFAFSPAAPVINASYVVSQQLTAEKAAAEKAAAEKAAAEKAAAEKAAAEKAAQDKVAADKAEIRNLLDSVANQIASLKLKYGANIVRVQQSTFDRLNLAFQVVNESGYSEIHLLAQKVQSELLALEQVFAKEKSALKKTTITCIKGKVTKKVTGTNPKCPSGYKKK
jgi:hypothetical protein